MTDISYNINKLMRFIKKCRIEERCSQKEMAQFLGVTHLTYLKWETGKVEPRLSHIIKICSLLGLSLDELINFSRCRDNCVIELITDGTYFAIAYTLIKLLINTVGNINIGKAWYENFFYILDSDYYFLNGKTLFGLKYIKTLFGAHIYSFEKLIKRAIKDGLIEQLNGRKYVNENKKYIAMSDYSCKFKFPDQKEFIDKYLYVLSAQKRGYTLTHLQQFMRNEIPYKLTDLLSTIQYQKLVGFKHKPIIAIDDQLNNASIRL